MLEPDDFNDRKKTQKSKLLFDCSIVINDNLQFLEKKRTNKNFIWKVTLDQTIKLNNELIEAICIKYEIENNKSEKSCIYDYIYLCNMISYGLPVDMADDVFSHLSERYDRWKVIFSVRKAARLVTWHAFWIVVHHHWARIVKVCGGLAGLVGIKWIKDLATRFLS